MEGVAARETLIEFPHDPPGQELKPVSRSYANGTLLRDPYLWEFMKSLGKQNRKARCTFF